MVILLLLSHGPKMLDNNWRLGGTGDLVVDLVGRQSEALVALVLSMSIKDRTVGSVVASLKVPKHNRGLSYS